MIIKPGIYHDMPSKQYFAVNGLSKSGMVDLIQSPHHYKVRRKIGKEPTKSMIFGTAMHLAVLEPEKYQERIKEHALKTQKINSDGIISLHKESIAELDLIVSEVKRNAIASGLLNGCQKEVSVFWNDELDFMCKARIDALNMNLHFVIDLKYCTDASYDAFSRQSANLKYHWQAYWYLKGLRQFYQDPFNFIFICIEGAPTYSIATYLVTDQMLSKAEPKIDECRNIYASCLESDEWQGYPEQIQELYLPHWA